MEAIDLLMKQQIQENSLSLLINDRSIIEKKFRNDRISYDSYYSKHLANHFARQIYIIISRNIHNE